MLERFKLNLPFSRTLKHAFEMRHLEPILKEWALTTHRKEMLLSYFEDYKTNYLAINIKGKTVLDVGAGEGETALFYLLHGAKKVICVEADKHCSKNLLANSKKFPIIPILEPFKLSHLQILHDFLKVDIEGYEEILLETTLKRPAVIEVHGLQLRDKFKKRGYLVLNTRVPSNMIGMYYSDCTTYAFWKCKPNL